MKVRTVMTPSPVCCTPDMPLAQVARLMVECDCGAIPVAEGLDALRPVGVVTDRDVVCRAVAEGRNPADLTAADVMTSPCVTVTPDADVEECCRLLEQHQLRRVVVVDEAGCVCGIVAQADVARRASARASAEVVRHVSAAPGSAGRA